MQRLGTDLLAKSTWLMSPNKKESGTLGDRGDGVFWLVFTVSRKSAPAPGGVEKRTLGMDLVCLDERALEIELSQELFEHRPLVVAAGGIAGWLIAKPKAG